MDIKSKGVKIDSKAKPIIYFDFETTGVNTAIDRIVQIGAVKITVNADGSESKEVKDFLINPEIPIPVEASEVHGITDEKVANAPKFSQIAKGVAAWFSDSHLCGFNSNSFDLNMLIAELERAGVEFEIGGDLIDVMLIYRKLYPNSLGEIYKRLIGKELENAHDTISDIGATKEILDFLVENHRDQILEETGSDKIDSKTLDLFTQGDKLRVDLAGKMYEDLEGNIRWNFSKNKDQLVSSDYGFSIWFLKQDFPEESKEIVRKIFTKI